MTLHPVILGLGANLGRPAAQLAEALRRLEDAVRLERLSSLYRSAPVGYADQPDFLNLVAVGRTALSPEELLARAQAVERALGREPGFRNAPRPIDIDLLDYAGRVLRTPALVLPHPGIAARGFVLHPLAEAAPGWRHPVLGRTARELLSAAAALERVERVGPLPRPE
ncbi:MAG TPA: 2-amino-4-hydroxy-6-hydroxymethyldihydropteridine diphosphokinase [Longimicrobiaceae bacterium]|nr:2-amino-4-hydroxy-6-hydroxymethyldihydropteridine diphosphokinase [Longimicrobiaceae bacterium]